MNGGDVYGKILLSRSYDLWTIYHSITYVHRNIERQKVILRIEKPPLYTLAGIRVAFYT